MQQSDVDKHINFIEVLLGLLSLLKRLLKVRKRLLHAAAVL